MKFIVKSDLADSGEVEFINVNNIASIKLCMTYNYERKEPKIYYNLKMVDEIDRLIQEEADIKELESVLLESGINLDEIEELKRRVAAYFQKRNRW